jgi:hypothetical protein
MFGGNISNFKIKVFWDTMPCSLVASYYCFGKTCWINFQCGRETLLLWRQWQQVSHLRRLTSSYSPLTSQISGAIQDMRPDYAEHPWRLQSQSKQDVSGVTSYIRTALSKSDMKFYNNFRKSAIHNMYML